MNEDGFVTGTIKDDKGIESEGFLWSMESGTTTFELNGNKITVSGMNSKGQVIGTFFIEDHSEHCQGYLFDPLNGISNLESLPIAIDEQGIIVGNHNSIIDRSFIWSAEHGMQNLEDMLPKNSGWKNLQVISISQKGFILAKGLYFGTLNYCVLQPTN